MKRLLRCGLVIAALLPAVSCWSVSVLTTLLAPRDIARFGMQRVAEVAVGPRGEIALGGADAVVGAGDGRPLAKPLAGPLSGLAFAPDGALLAVVGRSLGYIAGGRFVPQVALPRDGMRLAIGHDRLYLHEAAGDGPYSLYLLAPELGTVKLATFPAPIGAADACGDTLYFSVANDLYRLVPGGELRLLCRVPGPAISGVAATADAVFLLAGRTLYRYRADGFAEVARDLGERLARHDESLFILDAAAGALLRFDGLAALPTLSGDRS